MLILVLDDDVCSPWEPGELPAGKNRSELLNLRLREEGWRTLLFDGRDLAGKQMDAGQSARELERQVGIYAAEEGVRQVECDVILDLRWFNDETYGGRLLDELRKSPLIRVTNVLVLSVITDSMVRRQFIVQYGISRDSIFDRGGTGADKVVARLRELGR